MKKAVLFLDVPDTTDIAYLQDMVEKMVGKDATLQGSIEIVPQEINNSTRLYYWHYVGALDKHGVLRDQERSEIALRMEAEERCLRNKTQADLNECFEE
ncbi:hypothetical protein [Paenibacillus chitinolyticus]|uniref:hypothetical protein n=1 Tax=Paenibacillus chitinolyticus TaxID=79263 RepID=UPI00295E29E2|nr:hypothetical protein [Paenibacillus chitinolyticus]